MDTPQRTLMRMAWTLGLAGLIPFVGLALIAWGGDAAARGPATAALVSYGAIILAFVGALHWGAALVARDLNSTRVALALSWSVMPPLYAWWAVHLSAERALAALGFGLIAAWAVDLVLYRHHGAPGLGWFLALRLVLTTVGALSLFAGALALAGRA
ncbi:MAG: DUF3429 domain-containing protein [Burkholderiales bacterium]|nr:MAG: DUF3429 domain-containing protein [Burkholderiales bacterium]